MSYYFRQEEMWKKLLTQTVLIHEKQIPYYIHLNSITLMERNKTNISP